MEIIVLAVVGLLLLTGLITFGMGNKGWSWGTLAAAILVLLASTTYLYFAARIAERERAWTKVVKKYEADVLRARDATTIGPQGKPQPLPDERSLDVLATERARWQRAFDRIDTWHGRRWGQGSFEPPQAGKPGSLTLAEAEPATEPAAAADAEPAAAEGEKKAAKEPQPPLNVGAQVAVFDDTAVEEGGSFLGVFRVVEVAFDAASRKSTLSIVPAVDPDARDVALWKKSYDTVSVYEDLPVDRWLAFYRTSAKGEDSGSDGVMPEPERTDPKDLLEKLEEQYERFEQHEAEVTEDPRELARKVESGEAAPGRYWAEVEFEGEHQLDEKVVEQIKALLQPDFADEDRIKTTFEPGEKATFDLQTALALEGTAKILRVIDRRPLADAFTTLLGGKLLPDADVRADGIASLRRTLQGEIAALEEATARLESAAQNVAGQRKTFTAEQEDLSADKAQWTQDVTAADETMQAFQRRLEQLTGELDGALRSIGGLGQELTAAQGRLAAAIDEVAPAAAPVP